MDVKLDGFVAESKEWFGDLYGLATDDSGNLYVYSSLVKNEGGSSPNLQVFDRTGKYLRTIMPMPANLPKEKILPFNKTNAHGDKEPLNPPGKYFYPRNYTGVWPSFYSRLGTLLPRVGSDNQLMFLCNYYPMNLAAVTTDGGCPNETMWRKGFKQKLWGDLYNTRGKRCVVKSPDGKYIYMCGLGKIKDKKTKKLDPAWPLGRIYRMKNDPKAFFEKWVDLPDGESPAAAAAACFDSDGNLMVFNAGTGKAAVLDSDGKQIGEFPALIVLDGKNIAPKRLLCHRKTGEIYADYVTPLPFTGGVCKRKLVKFSPWKQGAAKIVEMDLPKRKTWSSRGDHFLTEMMAIDDSADPAIVWIGTAGVGRYNTAVRFRTACYLLRLEDRGKEFVKTEDLVDRCRHGVIAKSRLAVHPETDLVIYNDGYCGLGGVNGLTGEKVELPMKDGQDMGVGLDGNWYIHETGGYYQSPICRYSKDLKPLPVPGQKPAKNSPTNMLGRVYSRHGAGYCTTGLTADPKGRVYSLQLWKWVGYGVAIYGPDGKPEDPGRLANTVRDKNGVLLKDRKGTHFFKSVLVGDLGRDVGGVQIDWQGNVYIGKKVVPPDHKPPAGYERGGGRYSYNYGVGTVIKFPPSGGGIIDAKDAEGKEGIAVIQRYKYRKSLVAE
jgi:hypothetical protein